MNDKCLCQRVFKRHHFAVAFSAMFALHSSLLLADVHVQDSDIQGSDVQASDVPDSHVQSSNDSNTASTVSASQDSTSGHSGAKVMGFSMPENAFNFPEWPVKQAVAKDMPPPPPLGPYMSTALNGEQTGEPHFESMITVPVPDFEKAPITTFSPDLPWPGDKNSANRWAPEKGYTFVAPNARPPQPVFKQNVNRGNAYQANPQRQQNHYSRPSRPVSSSRPVSMPNTMMNNRPMYNAPVRRAPGGAYPGYNYPGPNYPGPNHSGSNRTRPYTNAMPQHRMNQQPQVNTGYNRSAYGAPPQIKPSSGHQR